MCPCSFRLLLGIYNNSVVLTCIVSTELSTSIRLAETVRDTYARCAQLCTSLICLLPQPRQYVSSSTSYLPKLAPQFRSLRATCGPKAEHIFLVRHSANCNTTWFLDSYAFFRSSSANYQFQCPKVHDVKP
jgi:hypothetical protein